MVGLSYNLFKLQLKIKDLFSMLQGELMIFWPWRVDSISDGPDHLTSIVCNLTKSVVFKTLL